MIALGAISGLAGANLIHLVTSGHPLPWLVDPVAALLYAALLWVCRPRKKALVTRPEFPNPANYPEEWAETVGGNGMFFKIYCPCPICRREIAKCARFGVGKEEQFLEISVPIVVAHHPEPEGRPVTAVSCWVSKSILDQRVN